MTSAVQKINNSGLSPHEKMSLKVLTSNNATVKEQITEDEAVDDLTLRGYLAAAAQTRGEYELPQ